MNMKKLNLIWFSLLLLPISLSCKKYEGDDSRSSYTVKGRLIKGVWNLKKIEFGQSSSPLETGDDTYACALDFGVSEGTEKLEMRWGYLIERDTISSFNLSSDKESIEFFNTEFEIYSMTWTDMILESKESGNRYFFEKWIIAPIDDFPIEYDIGFYMPFW